jgi:hypothetical protein
MWNPTQTKDFTSHNKVMAVLPFSTRPWYQWIAPVRVRALTCPIWFIFRSPSPSMTLYMCCPAECQEVQGLVTPRLTLHNWKEKTYKWHWCFLISLFLVTVALIRKRYFSVPHNFFHLWFIKRRHKYKQKCEPRVMNGQFNKLVYSGG